MRIAPAALIFAASTMVCAQPPEIFKGRISGGPGDRGKCTIDLVVDGTVDVEVSGSDGRARVITGARPLWRRLQCNMPMPPNPAEFRFIGQEGRGRQTLIYEPGRNRGVAVVRIEDADSGSEGYKFDLEWRGVTNSFNSGTFGTGGNGGRSGDGQGGIIPGGRGVAGWNEQVNFQNRGDGYYRDFKGADEMLRDASIVIDNYGRVQVDFATTRRDRIVLRGDLISANRDRLTATINSGAIQGSMEILLDGRKRVRELAMTGVGRNRFELRWNAR